MRTKSHGFVIGIACAAMLASSTAAAAAAPPPASTAAPSPWLTLSQMNSTGAAVLASEGVVAAQPSDIPPPSTASGLRLSDRDVVPWPVIGVWLVVIAAMIYIATKNNGHGHIELPIQPVSPA